MVFRDRTVVICGEEGGLWKGEGRRDSKVLVTLQSFIWLVLT